MVEGLGGLLIVGVEGLVDVKGVIGVVGDLV